MKKSTIMKQKRLKKKYDILSKGEVTELLDYNYRLIIMTIKKYSFPRGFGVLGVIGRLHD